MLRLLCCGAPLAALVMLYLLLREDLQKRPGQPELENLIFYIELKKEICSFFDGRLFEEILGSQANGKGNILVFYRNSKKIIRTFTESSEGKEK